MKRSDFRKIPSRSFGRSGWEKESGNPVSQNNEGGCLSTEAALGQRGCGDRAGVFEKYLDSFQCLVWVRRDPPWRNRTITLVWPLRARHTGDPGGDSQINRGVRLRRQSLCLLRPQPSAAGRGIRAFRALRAQARPQRGKVLSHSGGARWIGAGLGPDPPPLSSSCTPGPF